jgi:hypothetical protein
VLGRLLFGGAAALILHLRRLKPITQIIGHDNGTR